MAIGDNSSSSSAFRRIQENIKGCSKCRKVSLQSMSVPFLSLYLSLSLTDNDNSSKNVTPFLCYKLTALMPPDLIAPSVIHCPCTVCLRVCVYTELLLEVVRLQEFTVIQQISQVSHKPPIV